MPDPVPTPDEVLDQLKRITSSDVFKGKERLSAFLKLVVERTVMGKKDEIKERTIGVEVYKRRSDYDTKLDPIVRDQAQKLRAALNAYQATVGAGDPVRIEVPKGAYVAEYRYNDVPVVDSSAVNEPAEPGTITAKRDRSSSRLTFSRTGTPILAASVIAMIAAIGVALWFNRTESRALDTSAQPQSAPETLRAEAQRLYVQADDAFKHEHYETVRALMDRAIRMKPDEAAFWHLRGMTHRRLRNLDEAISDLGQAIHLRPEFPFSYYERGGAYNAKGDPASAIEDESKAIKLGGQDAKADLFFQERGTAHLRLAARLSDKDHEEKAFRDFDEAVRRNSKNGWAFASRAEVFLRRKKYQDALADCNKALELLPPPDHLWVLKLRADAKEALGDKVGSSRDRELMTKPHRGLASQVNAR